jgi:hypothetical protein
MIPHIAPLFKLSRDKLSSETDETRVVNSAIDLIGAVVMAVPTFMAPAQLGDSLLAAIQVDVSGSGKHFDALIASVAKRVPTPNLLPVVVALWSRLLNGSDNVSDIYDHTEHSELKNLLFTGVAKILPARPKDNPTCEQGFVACACQGCLCLVPGRFRSMQRPGAPQHHRESYSACVLGHG